MSINDTVNEFLQNTKEITTLRKQITIFTKQNKQLEEAIKNYLTTNNMDSISLESGQVFVYDKKINATLKPENMALSIKNELSCDDVKAEKIVKSIVDNKVFNVQKSLKTKHN